MIGSAIRLAVLVSCTLTLCQGQGQDATLVEGGSGAKIVDTVVNRIRSRCIFSEDRLFLRRLARVQSADGTESFTYRQNFHGGIWQVTESMFNATKACTNSYLTKACSNITSELGIQWSTVRYSELRKPLYSGLAAALATLRSLKGNPMPASVGDQANKMVEIYGSGDAANFRNNSDLPAVGCNDKLDLIFILDSSGSVSYSDFRLMLNFTADVVGQLNLSSDSVRVADIVYGSSARLHFDFDDYRDKADAQSRLLSTKKANGGTNTAQGLDLANQTLFSTSTGARDDAKKVAILVTDGRSNSFSATNQSAAQLKEGGATVFAIGVGNYLRRELDAVASSPICSHVLTLTSFDHIQSLMTEIFKITCEANFKLKENTVLSGNISASGSGTTAETSVPAQTDAIEATVSCGILNIYVSYNDPKPSDAVHDSRFVSMPGRPAILTFPTTMPSGTRVYVTIVGTRLPDFAAQARQCSDFSWSLAKLPKKNLTVTCAEDGVPHTCTKDDVIRAGLCQNDNWDFPFENPCTKKNLKNGLMRHPYPYDSIKFLQCDMKGRAYVTQCPGGVSFNKDTRECGFTSPPLNDGSTRANTADRQARNSSGLVLLTPLPTTQSNPCTTTALTNNIFYHENPADNTSFIQCDEWGKAYVRPCAPSTVWSQTSYTCVKKAKRAVVTATTAATSSCDFTCSVSSPVRNADPCDRRVYHVCDHGRKITYRCQPGGDGRPMRYDPIIENCNFDQ